MYFVCNFTFYIYCILFYDNYTIRFKKSIICVDNVTICTDNGTLCIENGIVCVDNGIIQVDYGILCFLGHLEQSSLKIKESHNKVEKLQGL